MDGTSRQLLKEDRVHGSSLLPLAVYEVTPNLGEKGFDLHWHDEAEFFLVLEGEVLFQVDTDYFSVQAGEAVFIDSGVIHAALDASSTLPSRFIAIVFDLAWLSSRSYDSVQRDYISPLQEKTKTFPRHILPHTAWENQILTHLWSLMNTFMKQAASYEIRIKALLLLMISELSDEEGRACNRSESITADTTKIERLKTIIMYMQTHFHRKITIRELAAIIPMSEGQFNRFFKSMTRTTPIEYLNTYRLNKAADLLTMTDRKISAIAMDVGFDNLSYFIKMFRKLMKCSPSEFRSVNGNSMKRMMPIE